MARSEIIVSSWLPDGMTFEHEIVETPTAVEDGYKRFMQLFDSFADHVLLGSVSHGFDDNLTGNITLISPSARPGATAPNPSIPQELELLQAVSTSTILTFGSMFIDREPVNFFTVAADSSLLKASAEEAELTRDVARYGTWLAVSTELSSKLNGAKEAPDKKAMRRFLQAEQVQSSPPSDIDKFIALYGDDPEAGIALGKRFVKASTVALTTGLATTATAVALDKRGKSNRLVNTAVIAAGLQLGAAIVGHLVGKVIQEDASRIRAHIDNNNHVSFSK